MKTPARLILAAGLLLVAGAMVGQADLSEPAQAQSVEEAADTRRADDGARARRVIKNDTVAPIIAPAGADVTVVVFSDYQCPYCRKIHPAIEQLMREDRKVKLVYRDWPIFGAPSMEAARVAIAANYQGKHAAFNDALMRTSGRITSDSIRAAATKAGVNWPRLQADMKAKSGDIDGAIGRTRRYAAMMGLTGTPALLVGPYLIPGAVDVASLRRVVAMARQKPDG